MVLIARVGGITAALTWVIGAPLVALATVPFPSDAEYFLIGVVAALLGLALAPVALAMSRSLPSRWKAIVRLSGLAVFIALIVSGVLLFFGVAGRLGETAPAWIRDIPVDVFAALFVWIGLASFALRRPSTFARSTFWVGLLTSASFLVPVIALIVLGYVVPGFVFTNETVLPFLLIDVLLWVSLPAWLIVVVVGIS